MNGDIINKVNSERVLLAIADELMKQFGDEGHDIGDAGSFDDLMSNVFDEPHDSYTRWDMKEALIRAIKKHVKATDNEIKAVILDSVFKKDDVR